MKTKIYNQKCEVVGEVDLPSEIAEIKIDPNLVHEIVRSQMANVRQVLAHTKTRAEVRGGGKKPWKQKGTGRARAGSNRSPLWVGGGIIFGPRNNRNFKVKINKKINRKAMCMALGDKFQQNSLLIFDKLVAENYSTKQFDKFFKTVETEILGEKNQKNKRSILVINNKDEKVRNSIRNLSGVEIINNENINLLDLIKFKYIIMTQNALESLSAQNKKEN